GGREGKTISQMLMGGGMGGFVAPRPPSFMTAETKNVGWLFRDPTAAAKDYFKRTGVFPIMHLIGIRKMLVEKHPYLPVAVFKAFEASKAAAFAALCDTSATKVTLPFVEERLKEARDLMGDDFWAYGVEPNRRTLETFLGQHPLPGRLAGVEGGGGVVSPLGVRAVQVVGHTVCAPSPRSGGERVGVRGLSASRAFVETPLTPTLSPLRGARERRQRA